MPGVSVPMDIFKWMHEFEAVHGRRPVGAVIRQRRVPVPGGAPKKEKYGPNWGAEVAYTVVNDFEMVAADPGPMKGAMYMTLGDWMFHPVTQDEIESTAERCS